MGIIEKLKEKNEYRKVILETKKLERQEQESNHHMWYDYYREAEKHKDKRVKNDSVTIIVLKHKREQNKFIKNFLSYAGTIMEESSETIPIEQHDQKTSLKILLQENTQVMKELIEKWEAEELKKMLGMQAVMARDNDVQP